MSTTAFDLRSPSARDVWAGIAAGAVGGAVASWVMDQFQARFPPPVFAKLLGEPAAPANDDGPGGGDSGGDDPPVKAAEAISKEVLGHPLTPREKQAAEPVMHYGVGILTGAAYGAAAEVLPAVTVGVGAGMGTAVWVGAYEVIVPALGLTGPPWTMPASMQVFGLALNLVYGVTTEVVRRGVRGMLA